MNMNQKYIQILLIVISLLTIGCDSKDAKYDLEFDKGLDAARSGNIDKAKAHWEPIATDGYSGAQYNLGKIYSQQENYTKSFYWFEKAAQQENLQAQVYVGMMYYGGIGTVQDLKRAAYWYEKAAKNGDPDAQRSLAEMYCYGQGVLRDLQQCSILSKKAHEQGKDVSKLWNQFELWKYQ